MQFSPNDNQYLVTEVFTAPPQKLQLMLIEAAIRLAGRTRHQWQAGENGQASLSLMNAQEIVDQLIGGLNRDVNPELVDRVEAVYEFISARLKQAGAQRDGEKLQDAIRVLEIQRETWRQVCDDLRDQGRGEDQLIARLESEEPRVPSAPHLHELNLTSDLLSSGLSLEA
jgi:flagellar protein FliS